jgi:hypothetical protein
VRVRPLFVAVAATLAVALPASAQTTFVPTYTETPVYLQCNGTTKVSQVNFVAEGAEVVTWDSTKPTASFTTGAGCGTVDPYIVGAAPGNPVYDLALSGTFTGNLRDLTVRLWGIDTSGSRAFNEFDARVYVSIDGRERVPFTTAIAGPMVASSTGISRLVEFSVTNLNLSSEADSTKEHTIEITVGSIFLDSSGLITWVYDASEIDSGIVFNPARTAATKIRANA